MMKLRGNIRSDQERRETANSNGSSSTSSLRANSADYRCRQGHGQDMDIDPPIHGQFWGPGTLASPHCHIGRDG